MINTSGISAGTGMIEFIKQWIEFRRALRRRWQVDARRLAEADPIDAYYEA
jgi:hypothetical protein